MMRFSRFCCGTADAKILAPPAARTVQLWVENTDCMPLPFDRGPNLKLLDRLRRRETVASVLLLSCFFLSLVLFSFCSLSSQSTLSSTLCGCETPASAILVTSAAAKPPKSPVARLLRRTISSTSVRVRVSTSRSVDSV